MTANPAIFHVKQQIPFLLDNSESQHPTCSIMYRVFLLQFAMDHCIALTHPSIRLELRVIILDNSTSLLYTVLYLTKEWTLLNSACYRSFTRSFETFSCFAVQLVSNQIAKNPLLRQKCPFQIYPLLLHQRFLDSVDLWPSRVCCLWNEVTNSCSLGQSKKKTTHSCCHKLKNVQLLH